MCVECDWFCPTARRPRSLLPVIQVDHRRRLDGRRRSHCHRAVLTRRPARCLARSRLQHTGPLPRPAETLPRVALHVHACCRHVSGADVEDEGTERVCKHSRQVPH